MPGSHGPPDGEFAVWRPSRALHGLVADCHGYRYSLVAAGTHRGLPSSAMTVVIAIDEPLDVGWHAQPATRGAFWGLASGLHTAPAEIFHEGRQFGIQLGLTAIGARTLLGMPMGALARELVALDDLLPARGGGWYDEIAAQPTWAGRFEALECWLLGLARAHAGTRVAHIRPELVWAWSRMEASGGRAPVSAVASALGWSRRHLHEQFSREYGVAPKQAARIIRFQRSRALFVDGGTPLAAVAAECGYADQSHLTREWRALSGYSPWQWMAAELPNLQDRGLLDLTVSSHA
jgi:AraC-like DNA-binding protein